ncbi:GFA family protein [Acidimangrovimonas pyrenivorans]|uniref:GFA family protein n=1 Tax=Acidimangrovimonas pyrenivorans TaxID=2030798 RepID=A0ABV7AC38_9RHOB
MSGPDSEHHEGGCLCGAVRFEVTGALPRVAACHCDRCRSWSGHVWAASPVPHTAFRLTRDEGLDWVVSSEHVKRGFCRHCGSSLFWQDDREDRIAVAAGAFDGPTGTRLEKDLCVEEAGDYYRIPGHETARPEAPDRLTAECLCGSVRFTLPGPAGAVTACHCSQCRRSSGHFAASFDVDEASVVYESRETLAEYETPGFARRGFCRQCGSSLWYRAGDGAFAVEAGAIRGPTGGRLVLHIFTEDKGDYYEIGDDLLPPPKD